jgi:hypothetical protein
MDEQTNDINTDDSQFDLDMKWIEEFESLDENYKAFYSEDITYINFNYIYVNKENDVEKVKKETLLLKDPNYISREEIIGILKKNYKVSDKQYTILSILKYNINLEPSDIQHFLKKPSNPNQNPNHATENSFLNSIQNIDAIPLEQSISMFQDLNEIFIIFYEKTDADKNTSPTRGHNHTKRIYLKTIRTNKKRTYRKTT